MMIDTMNKLQQKLEQLKKRVNFLKRAPKTETYVSYLFLSLITLKAYIINYLSWPKSDWFVLSPETMAMIQQLEWTIPILAHETFKSISIHHKT